MDQITCRVLNTTNPNLQFTHSMTQLVKEDFLCPYTTHCLALCLCCDFLACDCQVRTTEAKILKSAIRRGTIKLCYIIWYKCLAKQGMCKAAILLLKA